MISSLESLVYVKIHIKLIRMIRKPGFFMRVPKIFW